MIPTDLEICLHIMPMPPGQSRGICSHCQPGGGAFANFIAAWGLGISVLQGNPRAFHTRVFERWMSLSGRTRPMSKPKLPAEGTQYAKRYIVFIFYARENKECSRSKKRKTSFVQKRRNFVTRLLVVCVVTGHYKVTFLYENLIMSTCTCS